MTENFVKDYISIYQESPNGMWSFDDGCMLQSLVNLYQVSQDSEYKDYIAKRLKGYIDSNGFIIHYSKEEYNLDYINMGNVLLFLYRLTEDLSYKNAAFLLMDQLKSQPRSDSGNFLSKKTYQNQIWLESLFMYMPFYMEYETKYHDKEQYNDIIAQLKKIRKQLFHSDENLYNFTYFEKENRHNAIFLLRPIGYFLMALIDTLEWTSEEIFEHYKTIEGLFKEALKGILPYQDKKTNLFYQIVDQPSLHGNYLETSGSLMIAYAILKGCRLGALSKERYLHLGLEILSVIEETGFNREKDHNSMIGICPLATGGSNHPVSDHVNDYLLKPDISKDSKGISAYILAYSERLRTQMMEESVVKVDI